MKKIIILLLFILNVCVFSLELTGVNVDKFADKLLSENYILEVGDDYENYEKEERTSNGLYLQYVTKNTVDGKLNSITINCSEVYGNTNNQHKLKKEINKLVSYLIANTKNSEIKKLLKVGLSKIGTDTKRGTLTDKDYNEKYHFSIQEGEVYLIVTNTEQVKEIRIEARKKYEEGEFQRLWKELGEKK